MTELDIQAQKDYAVKEALAEGEAKGKAEGKLEIAKNLRAMGLPVEQIVRATGLSADEILSL
jgi:predicted transposase/invertase (TIGR01784 family)